MQWVIQVDENRERDMFAEHVARTHITLMTVLLRIRDLPVGRDMVAEENVGRQKKSDVSLFHLYAHSNLININPGPA